ncbi:type II secretion system minor pseudopilin GspK [Ectothiorhodospiraceae bacterium 2226]|nr:type II secretion system minor pseudopilin GspK [Ectothiorhodospiraceae bacterium 2226]
MNRHPTGRRRLAPSRRRQRGVALITALLVVALATIAAVAMAARQHVDIRRSANVLMHDQAYQYAVAGEQWAAQILMRDRRDNDTDHLGEPWAQVLPPMPLDEGTLAGALEDLQGRFNLNNLLLESGEPSLPDVARFMRLLHVLELDDALVDTVLDWIDPNIEPTVPDGAEDTHYLGLEAPYRTPNQLMASVSELRLIKGVDAEVYQALAPYVTALPGRTAINVNTAPAPVIAALAPAGMSLPEAEALVEARDEEGYPDLDTFLAQFPGQDVSTDGLSLATAHFLLRVEVRMGSARLNLYSVLQRHDQGVVTLARGQGAL